MITLTSPIQVTAVLGSAGKTNYDRLDVTTIVYDVTNKNINGACSLLASAAPSAAAIPGSYSIPTTGAAILTISIPTLLYAASLALTTAQQATVQGWIASGQNTVEAGLVAINVVAGVQSAGS